MYYTSRLTCINLKLFTYFAKFRGGIEPLVNCFTMGRIFTRIAPLAIGAHFPLETLVPIVGTG